MFEMRESGLSVSEAASKFKASQVQDSNEQPKTNDVVNVSDDTQKPVESEQPVVESKGEELETEESETVTVDETTAIDEVDELFYDIDGEEVSASQLKEWKAGNMMQADYTRKTQTHADEVKQFKILQDEFTVKQQKLEQTLAEFEAVMSEDAISAEDLKELREYEPEKYIEYVEKKQKREKLVSESKTLTNKQGGNFEQEYGNFAKSQDGWLVDNQPTDKFKADVAVMTAYADANGFTHDDLTGMRSHHFKALLDAAKYNASKSKADVMTKQVRKAPPITKPKQQAKTNLQTDIDAAEATLKRTGKIDDAVKLARLKRQLTTN